MSPNHHFDPIPFLRTLEATVKKEKPAVFQCCSFFFEKVRSFWTSCGDTCQSQAGSRWVWSVLKWPILSWSVSHWSPDQAVKGQTDSTTWQSTRQGACLLPWRPGRTSQIHEDLLDLFGTLKVMNLSTNWTTYIKLKLYSIFCFCKNLIHWKLFNVLSHQSSWLDLIGQWIVFFQSWTWWVTSGPTASSCQSWLSESIHVNLEWKASRHDFSVPSRLQDRSESRGPASNGQ